MPRLRAPDMKKEREREKKGGGGEGKVSFRRNRSYN